MKKEKVVQVSSNKSASWTFFPGAQKSAASRRGRGLHCLKIKFRE